VGPLYGLMLTAWGTASAFGPPLLANTLKSTGGYRSGLHIIAIIMIVSVVLPILVSPPKEYAAKTPDSTGESSLGFKNLSVNR
jgi:MFS transporter, OFA family, oxalate/formate antiporter